MPPLARLPLAAIAAALLTLGACSDDAADEPVDESAEPPGDTLAEAISAADGLTTVAEAIGAVGLGPVFDGAGSYTIFAPNDAAFAELREAGVAPTDPSQRAVTAAILRDHIVPGYLTPADIETAIDAKGGTVRVETMGDHTLRFSRDGEDIRVTNEDGATAMIAGPAVKARNGVAIPLDGVLKDLTPTA